jgi:hypothetical protein
MRAIKQQDIARDSLISEAEALLVFWLGINRELPG